MNLRRHQHCVLFPVQIFLSAHPIAHLLIWGLTDQPVATGISWLGASPRSPVTPREKGTVAWGWLLRLSRCSWCWCSLRTTLRLRLFGWRGTTEKSLMVLPAGHLGAIRATPPWSVHRSCYPPVDRATTTPEDLNISTVPRLLYVRPVPSALDGCGRTELCTHGPS